MELRVVQQNTFQFENKEYLKNRAKDILNRQGASRESLENILEKTIFTDYNRTHAESQFAIIKASSQISMNNSLKETLNYLKLRSVSKKNTKKAVLGELWDIFSETRFEDIEIFEPEIDESIKNIFAAA